MTIRKLLLTLSIVLSCGLIVGGIVNAQEAPKAPQTPKASKAPKSPKDELAKADWDFDFDFEDFDFKFDNKFDFKFDNKFDFKFDDKFDWQGDDRSFTLFLQGGTFLGVHVEDVSKENMATYGMSDVRGVGVTEVVKDSPAEKAGLRKGDVLLAFNGEPVTSTRKLSRLVHESSADQNVRLTISRGGSQQEVSATLSKGNPNMRVWNDKIRTEMKEKIEKMRKDMPKIKAGDGTWVINTGSYRRIGISTQTLNKQLAEYFGVSEGVLVTSVSENSAAAKAGLKAGDVITGIDGEKVDSPGDISRAINKKEEGPVVLTVVRDRSTRSITVVPEKPPAGTGDIRTIVVPQIDIPLVPPVNIQTPQIVIPAIPAINITVPTVPRVRAGVVII